MSSPQTQRRPPSNSKQAVGDGAAARKGLPDRNVTAATIEDAYMSFIFHCNPALPQECDTEALREAFRTPPKSSGKGFDIFLVYELVKKFYAKEIKTWTELTIKLGVEPPDPSKDESSQKITQYGVRLKKWLNSLHVKSFFEYLMDIPNEYWTNIPDGSDPIGQSVRDGVSVEDDMALRALLPHIRPKRGRKRPDDGETPVSAQRPRLSPSSAVQDQRHSGLTPWPAIGESNLSSHLETPRSAHPGLGGGDSSQTPFSRHPISAITPTTKSGFWDDMREPQSAITPSQPKIGRQRRGAKNVSSAWNFGAPDSSAKTRGRPRINRTPIEGPGFSFQSWNPAQNQTVPSSVPNAAGNDITAQTIDEVEPTMPASQPTQAPAVDQTASAPASGPGQRNRSTSEAQRPARPSISLQVPQRTGGPIRLATPPPAVMLNGQEEPQPANDESQQDPSTGWHEFAKEATDQYEAANRLACDGCSDASNVADYYFEKIEDRTNVDTLLAFFMRATQDGQWFDSDGNPAEPASMDEAAAIVNSTMQNMLKTATSTQAFLINLGALAGARTLMTSQPKYYRMPDGNGCHNYKFEWEYRFGHLRGHFNMAQSVPWAMWKKPAAEDPLADAAADESLSAEDWKQKYQSLLWEMKKREKELSDLRGKVMSSLREDLT